MYVVAIPMPDDCKDDLIDAFALTYGFEETIADPNNPGSTIPNVITKEQFLEDCVGRYMIEVVGAYLVRRESEAALLEAQMAVGGRIEGVREWCNTLRAQRELEGQPTFGGEADDPGFQQQSVEAQAASAKASVVEKLQSMEKRTRRSK